MSGASLETKDVLDRWMCSPCLVVEEVHCQAWCNTESTSISSNLASPGCIQVKE